MPENRVCANTVHILFVLLKETLQLFSLLLFDIGYLWHIMVMILLLLLLLFIYLYAKRTGLLIAVVPRYRYCSGATFTVAVAPILLAESSGDSSAATFLAAF